jgi:formiminoglutamase
VTLHKDPLWPRAGHWFREGTPESICDLNLIGVPTHRTSLSATQAHTTPTAVRAALMRYSTWSSSTGRDLADSLSAIDAGDVSEPDGDEGEARAINAISAAINSSRMTVILGGDNALTYSGASALADVAGGWDRIGVVTLDAHHDVRDGVSNGSPIKRLFDAGLDGRHLVQIGINDFANSRAYTERVLAAGATVIGRDLIRTRDIVNIVTQALAISGANGRAVYVDIDVDVCDRTVAPACPASTPGGIEADQLRQFARAFAGDPRVRAIDFTEVDAQADSSDQRTVRLVALGVLEVATGLALRS